MGPVKISVKMMVLSVVKKVEQTKTIHKWPIFAPFFSLFLWGYQYLYNDTICTPTFPFHELTHCTQLYDNLAIICRPFRHFHRYLTVFSFPTLFSCSQSPVSYLSCCFTTVRIVRISTPCPYNLRNWIYLTNWVCPYADLSLLFKFCILSITSSVCRGFLV